MLTTINVHAYYAVKIYKLKQTQQIFETGWRVPGSPVLDLHLG